MTRRIGPYEVVRELGRGGMGVVYEVTDPALPRRLALKLILDRADPDALARFKREVELLARVRHPNVVAVHAVGRAPEGPYVLMDLVEGEPLSRLVGRFDAARAVEVVRALCGAVEALHAQGVLHRDLKPQNVLVRPDGTPVLLDFGLARGVWADRLTRTGEVLGTPRYMAPEQAEGRGSPTHGARVDVYGLGAILFELLAGAPPFAEVQGGPIPALAAVLEREPRWPPVDAALGAVLRRAMARRPEDRFASAAELARALASGMQAPRQGRRARVRLLTAATALALATAAAAAGVAARREAPTSAAPSPVPDADGAPASEPEAPATAVRRADAPRVLRPGVGRNDEVWVAWAGRRLVTAAPASLLLWDVEGETASPAVSAALPDTALRVATHPGEEGDLWCGAHGLLLRIDGRLGVARPVWTGEHRVLAIAPSPDGAHVALGLAGGGALLLQQGRPPRRLSDAAHGHGFAWSPDGRRLFAALGEAGLGAWSLPDLEPLELASEAPLPLCVSVSPDGRRLAVGDAAGRLLLLDAATGVVTGRLTGPADQATNDWIEAPAHDGVVRNVAFAPDGRVIYSSSLDAMGPRPSQVRGWSGDDGRLLWTITPGGRLGQMALSPDGRWLALGRNGEALVWDLRALAGRVESSSVEEAR
ncbi:MAG: serine/threonine-protein kinase [Planctomycetes bacterium]|nr:serine/threonine-protein kinase [Planctomycetota bacterium]